MSTQQLPVQPLTDATLVINPCSQGKLLQNNLGNLHLPLQTLVFLNLPMPSAVTQHGMHIPGYNASITPNVLFLGECGGPFRLARLCVMGIGSKSLILDHNYPEVWLK